MQTEFEFELPKGYVDANGDLHRKGVMLSLIHISQPTNLRQRKLFEGSSQRRNVSGHPPDQVLFNRGEADGAVGLVVDVLRDARRVVDAMTELASGKNQLGEGSCLLYTSSAARPLK